MAGVLNFSEAAILALHSVELLALCTGRQVTSGELAEVLHCSPSHLAKVMQRLVHTGIVSSSRGPGGGFRLHRLTAQTSLLDVYEAIDGRLLVGQCLLGKEHCALEGCWLSRYSARVTQRVRSDLSNRRLLQLARQAVPAATQ